jgi:uncharacterized protein (TIGR03067 family)
MNALSAALIVIAFAEAAPAKVQGDLARIQGTWTAQVGARREIAAVMEVRGACAKICLTTPIGVRIRVEGRIAIDEAASPKALDWLEFTGVEGMDLPDLLAIYALDGDEFRICNGGPDNPRPTEFRAGEGCLADVITFRRAKGETVAGRGE